MSMEQPAIVYKDFEQFYKFYLREHSNKTCRRLHIIGSTISLLIFVLAVATSRWVLLPVGLVQGYAWAWVGHFVFEKNKPATFKAPWQSFKGDWRMWADTLTGKIPF